MRQIRKIVLKIAAAGCCLMFVSAMLCSCSSDDDTATPEDGNQRSMRQLTITRASSGMRKAKIDPTSLEAAWQATDRPTYVNLSAVLSGTLYYGLLTPAKAGVTTTLTGNVMCANADDIAVIFPAVTPVKPAGRDAYFPIDLSGQKGTRCRLGGVRRVLSAILILEQHRSPTPITSMPKAMHPPVDRLPSRLTNRPRMESSMSPCSHATIGSLSILP